MSDANQYVNTYLDQAMTMLHDNLNVEIRMKTELKIANDLLKIKDDEINSLREQVKNIQHDSETFQTSIAQNNEMLINAQKNAQQWESEVNAMRNKVSILETLQNQFNDLKRDYLNKEAELQKLKQTINKKASRKTINKEDTKSSSIPVTTAVMKVEDQKEIDDDF